VGCGGDLSVFGGDEDLLFACDKCRKTWQITVSALDAADAVIRAGRVVVDVRSRTAVAR